MQFEAVNAFVEHVTLGGKQTLRVIKDPRIVPFDEPTYARLVGANLHNGVIQVKVLSRLLPDAPDFSRGFIGVAFRINGANDQFEGLYIRPTNGRVDDPVRRTRAVQYFSYPEYKFDRLRNEYPGMFETHADIGLDEWIQLRIEVKDDTARLFLNGSREPALTVPKLFHGFSAGGGIGLWVDIGTEGYFADLETHVE